MRTIGVHDLADIPQAYVVDVREEHEYARGRIPGAVNIPMSALAARHKEMPSDRTVYLVCEVGIRSGQATQAMAAGGWDVVNVRGGTNAWINAGYPLEK